MTRRHLLTLIATAGTLGAFALATPARAATPTVETVPLQFTLAVAPEGLVGTTSCTVVADLYRPSDAGPANRVPAILTTNGFGGSKADQAGLGRAFAGRGYAVLSYSGLGFGGSGCKITLDDRAHDGAVASQLLRYLGGDPSVVGTRTDTGQPYRVDFVRLDVGTGLPYDPRVGMVGGSYGGQVQFAAAVDRRLDTIVPMITWNDLAYSLAPNNTSLPPTRVSYTTPGVAKFEWSTLFSGEGIIDGLEFATADPTRNVGCPNFDDPACPDLALLSTQGYPNAATIDYARAHSVASYLSKVTIPTLLAQGEADTLFNLQESVATYRSLRARGVPVKLIWQSWGHSHGTPAPGELDFANPTANYEGRVIAAWFDHYLKGAGPAPALDFSYFRDWVSYAGDAGPAYASAPSYPVGARQKLYLSGSCDLFSGTATLTASRTAIVPGTCSYANLAGPAPLSYTETSALDQTLPLTDAPGSYAKYTSAPLTGDLDVVGSPTLDVRVDAPAVAAGQQLDPGLKLVFFAKVYDVAPDGSVTLVHRLISPVRVTDVTRPVHVELPAIVHRFASGHRLAVVIAATDAAYRNATLVQPVTIRTDPSAPGVLTLPVIGGSLPRAVP